MSGPEDNPADEHLPTKAEWEAAMDHAEPEPHIPRPDVCQLPLPSQSMPRDAAAPAGGRMSRTRLVVDLAMHLSRLRSNNPGNVDMADQILQWLSQLEPSPEQVERVAMAMNDSLAEEDHHEWRNLDDWIKMDFMSQARAAIKAIQEGA